MFRKEVNPRVAAVAVVIILGVVQFAYWRLLVYREPGRPPGAGGPGGGAASQPFLNGLEDVRVETLAGSEPGMVDGPGWQARFSGPNALSMDAEGLLVADSRNHRIRRVSYSGRVSTIAGSGPPDGPGGRAEGPAAQAAFRYPSGVAALKGGAVAIADTGNHRICLLRNGVVTELAGGAEGTADGVGKAARFQGPAALTEGPDGALWVLDAGSMRVRRVDLQGKVTSPAQVPAAVRGVLGETRGAAAAEKIGGWEEAWTQPAESSFDLGYRGGGVAAGASTIFPDARYGTMLVQQPGGLPLLIAGRRNVEPGTVQSQDGDGTRCAFAAPCAAVAGPDGAIYVAEYEGNRVRKVILPEWLRSGQFTAPQPRGQWRRRRGN